MPDTHVLVPMQLDAMVLAPNIDTITPFLRFQMDYSQLQRFNDPEPAPFAGGSTEQPNPGIYLHWTLPQSLRHGVQQDDGSTLFPWVPNRWLVTRIQHGLPAPQSVKAWLVQSDYVGSDGTSPFVDPATLANAVPSPSGLGKSWLITQAPQLPSQLNGFLQAIGPGNATFSAFEPGVGDVLALYDDVTDNSNNAITTATTFTYYVAGWYSDAELDPLNTTTWNPNPDTTLPDTYVNSRQPWYVYATSDSVPTATITHAMSNAVLWDPGTSTLPPTYPEDLQNKVKVAVGATASDALVGLVAANTADPNAQTEADLLEAFQYGLLDQFNQPGTAEALNMAIQENWFSTSAGGTLWTAVANEVAGSTALPAGPPPPLTQPQQQALAALNAAQRELDRQQRVLDSMQWTLWGLWWMTQWQGHGTGQGRHQVPVAHPLVTWLATQLPLQIGATSQPTNPTGTDPTQEVWYAWKVNAQQNLVSRLAAAVTAANTEATAALAPSFFSLKATNMPAFYAPQDPVVLVTGLGRATNFDPTDTIMCRLPSQTASSLTVNGKAYTAASVVGSIPVLTDPRNQIPDCIQSLNTEALFLSPDLFAQAVLGSSSQDDAVTTAISALPGPAPGGQFPPLSFACEAWVQPWIPLLMDWEITVLNQPAYTPQVGPATATYKPIATFNQQNWHFDGTNFLWAGPTQSTGPNFNEASSGQMQLRGRTFITPQLSFTLAGQLDQYVTTHQQRDDGLGPLLNNLDAYVDQMATQDLLSQRLSGLLGQTIERATVQTVVPPQSIANLIGPSLHGMPMPYPDRISPDDPAVWDFAPFGGTFFVINQLTVIDAFGRSIDLTLTNFSTAPSTEGTPTEDYFYPIAGRGMQSPTGTTPYKGIPESTVPTQRMLKLAPHVNQDARLNFRLLSNDGTDTDISLEAGANPICGWVVPNHLDRSLAMYAPDGTAWGELFLSRHVGDTYVPAWQPDPTNANAPASVAAIPNGFVSAMLEALWNRTDNGTALSDLLLGIDQGLWTINPPGDRNDLDLDILVGRPLAIVRAELTLQVRGLPVTSQDWWNLFAVDPNNPPTTASQPVALAAVDGGISTLTWPIRLGSQTLRDDGLIGYFVDNPTTPANTYQTFNVVTLPPELQTSYLAQVMSGNFPQVRFIDDSVASPDPTQQQVVRLTMLVDPRGSVHAFSGLLPAVALGIPGQLVTPALKTMSYVFRAGPFLTSREAVRVPRPSAAKGTWAWFDKVLGVTSALTPADGSTSISTTSPLIKEGWLKFTPNLPDQQQNGS